jgi:D-alanyl-D-alanine dipeptidase
MGTPFYEQARAFLQRPVARALVRVNRKLMALGYGLLVHDAYRPWYVTKMFWDATPGDKKSYVADPNTGSNHNRGCAVDVGLYDLNTGQEVAMPSGYDEISGRAHTDFSGGTPEQRRRRDLLQREMKSNGFRSITNEWWHFDCKDYAMYPVMNTRFEQIPKQPSAQPLGEP